MVFGPLRRGNRSLQAVGNLGERLVIRVKFSPYFPRILLGSFFRVLLPKQIKPRSGVWIGIPVRIRIRIPIGLDYGDICHPL